MKNQHILILICCLLIGAANAQEQLNLEQAIAMTIANNPQIKQGEASKIAAVQSLLRRHTENRGSATMDATQAS